MTKFKVSHGIKKSKTKKKRSNNSTSPIYPPIATEQRPRRWWLILLPSPIACPYLNLPSEKTRAGAGHMPPWHPLPSSSFHWNQVENLSLLLLSHISTPYLAKNLDKIESFFSFNPAFFSGYILSFFRSVPHAATRCRWKKSIPSNKEMWRNFIFRWNSLCKFYFGRWHFFVVDPWLLFLYFNSSL